MQYLRFQKAIFYILNILGAKIQISKAKIDFLYHKILNFSAKIQIFCAF